MILEYSPKITLSEVPQLTQKILTKLEQFCSDKDILFDIKLSFEEALINAIKYGNKLDKNKPVIIKIEASQDKICFEIKDQGQGYDYQNLALPTEDENLEKLSGRGVYLIKNFMDEVEFLDNGSRIRMVKYIK
tara:strand:- start:18 stop:416 length:399 start_codon:yes stop_codon:yes gene_type:complete